MIRQTYTTDLEQRLTDAARLISESTAPALAAQDTQQPIRSPGATRGWWECG